MKKLLIIFVAALTVFSGMVYAAYQTNDATSGSLTLGSGANSTSIKLSNNIYLDYIAQATGLGYVAGAYHATGTRTFGTSSGDTKIFYQETTGVAIPSTAPSASQTADFGGWSAL